ncbi:MAG: putative photosynthetic complex assembly protein PuhE [Bradyrhizobium sp.]
MGTLAIAVAYVLFVWWFSTGAVLLLVGLSARHEIWLKAGAASLAVASLAGIVASSSDTDATSAYCAFTCAILLWGSVEISLLAGWITGPRPERCPVGITGVARVGYALQAIAYHELLLIAAAGLVFAVTSGTPNQLGWWTFASLLILRQSAKINLFLGVRTLNDELMPSQVDFLRSYFARGPMNWLFPVSVTAATSAAIFLAVTAVTATTAFDELAFALLAVLVALGALEHWFMVLPVSVTDLWRWSVRTRPVEAKRGEPSLPPARPVLSVIPGGAVAAERAAAKVAACSARQRLEEQFRQAYREQQSHAAALPIVAELASLTGGTRIEIPQTNMPAEGRIP